MISTVKISKQQSLMLEYYISNCPRLAYNGEALKILKDSDIIDGVELTDISEEFLLFKKHGVKLSSHTPGMQITLNLARKDFMNCFDGNHGKQLLRSFELSDAPTVGLHIGYSAERVYKMYSCPNIPAEGTLITDRDELMSRMRKNIVSFKNEVDLISPDKTVVIEGLDYHREMDVQWEIQPDESKKNKNEILRTISRYGINAGLLFVTDPTFQKELLETTNARNESNEIGYLLDIGHTYVTADTKIFRGEFLGTIEDYFANLLLRLGRYVRQLHISVPQERVSGGFHDAHGIFKAGEYLTEHIIELTKLSIEQAPWVRVITLEMKTGLDPIQHVSELERQLVYLHGKLNTRTSIQK